ncbi:MAG: UvrD-helicase domain-containing protein [Candidatus Margulisbacteria bacterium]|nr:UvrD-helicase domain-containing protein [Candidatus Margulisiibacteriota bacterium]
MQAKVVESLLTHLNKEQKQAVLYTDSPLLILAGAGSGKTRVLTHKIAYLHIHDKIPLQHILAVTFTNKAAQVMLARVEKLLGVTFNDYKDKWILTFHSLGYKILQRYADKLGYGKGFVIYDSNDQASLIKKIMTDKDIDTKNIKPTAVQYAISEAKNILLSPAEYEKTADNNFKEIVAGVYAEYQKQLLKNNAMDFDDLLLNVLTLFKENEDILQKYQKQFQFILIDEYQDINMPQYLIAHLLSNKHKHICVVGDIDQNIYSWRGANIQNILNFEKDYPDAKVIVLEQNYRSTGKILKIANSIIKHNKLRKEKNLWTENGEGHKATCFIAQNEYDEAEYIAKSIEKMIKDKINPNEIAILYRTNAMSRVLEELLLQYNIKYRVYGGFRFYERKEIKDILAYLRLVYNPKDDVSLTRIINIPTRKIGKLTVERLIEKSQQENISIMDVLAGYKEKNSETLNGFYQMIMQLRKDWEEKHLPLPELISRIIKQTGYQQMLEAEKTPEAMSRIENIQELVTATQEGEYTLEEFLSLSALMTQQDEPDKNEQAVTLMTLHSAKGLEYEVVFLCGFEENVLPHMQSLTTAHELEEERRLCYVGITRAKNQLFITIASHRSYYYEQSKAHDVSRFFYEIPKEEMEIKLSKKLGAFNHILSALKTDYVMIDTKPSLRNYANQKNYDVYDSKTVYDYQVGDQVASPIFGNGRVVKTIGHGPAISLQIQFGEDIKLIMPKYGKLEKVR